MTITKVQLSDSTNGRNIEIAATATPGTALHTAHATNIDEVWLWLTNTHTAEVEVTIEFGGVTATDDLVIVPVPAKSTVLAIPGWTLTGGLLLKAFAALTNEVNANGYVNRIAP